MAWQFHRDDRDEGLVQAFRRPGCREESLTRRLRGLDSLADYAVTDRDAATMRRLAGRRLMTVGLDIQVPNRTAAAILIYRKVGTAAAAP
jgi:hypothetical protein